MKSHVHLLALLASQVSLISAETIAQINGNRFLSSFNGQSVSNVQGLVTAKGPRGVWIRSVNPDNDPNTSESIYIFSNSIRNLVNRGDIISLNGNVQEYRADSDYLYLTEITGPQNVQVISSGNEVTPVILGTASSGVIGNKNLRPPTNQFTSLDNGNVFAVPNNQTLVSQSNPTLQSRKFGLDFWESLSGELVTIRSPIVLNRPNGFGDTFVRGDWPATGVNGRGGLTIRANDGNPESIQVVTPLDGSDNPLDSKLGDKLADITGIVQYAFGYYSLYPLTAVSVQSSQTPATAPPTRLEQSGTCQGITISDYNVENLTPMNANGPRLANQIVNALKSPTILFLQEVADNNGYENDSVVDASQTFENLIDSIVEAGGPRYNYTQINPIDDTTGGAPGANIRNGYIYNSAVVKLRRARTGSATNSQKILKGPHLAFNPGFIQPNSPAFTDSRRPLTAEWQTVDGKNNFFTINVHATSKGGSTTLEGDPRTPVNLGVDQRQAEASVVATFVSNILRRDPNARIIAAGDWNEFKFVQPQTSFVSQSGLADLDDVVGTTPAERYTYLFGMNCQALIHFYVSPAIAENNAEFDRIHVNTWANFDSSISDHDPDVAKLNVCA